MSTTAAKGDYGAATGYAYQSDYRLTHSARTAIAATRPPAQPNVSRNTKSRLCPNPACRGAATSARRGRGAGGRIIFVGIGGPVAAEGRMGVFPRAEKPKPARHPARILAGPRRPPDGVRRGFSPCTSNT